MSKLYDLKEIVAETGLPERTVRYYLAEVLETPSGTPGRKSYYDQLTVDQLMLAQQILMREYDPDKGEVKPTLREFREWLEGLDEAEVRRLVEYPYRYTPKALAQGQTVIRSHKPGSRFEAPDAFSASHSNIELGELKAEFSTQSKVPDSATDYLDRVMGPSVSRHPPQGATPTGPWATHRFGDALEIRTRRPLTDEQARQVTLAGELLKSILERGQP